MLNIDRNKYRTIRPSKMTNVFFHQGLNWRKDLVESELSAFELLV
jgi:hypothetical protein